MFKKYIIMSIVMLSFCTACAASTITFEKPTEPLPKITNNFEKEHTFEKPEKEKPNIYNSKPLRIKLDSNLSRLTEKASYFHLKNTFEIWKALNRIFINDHPVAQMGLLYSHLGFLEVDAEVNYTIIVSLNYEGKKYILNGRSSPLRDTKIAIEEALMQIYVQARYIISH